MTPSSALTLSQTHPHQGFLFDLAQKLEHLRIRNHLKLTEKQLRAKDVSHLSPRLQKRRAENLDRLHDYWQADEFPKNLDFPGRQVPYFIDAAGIPCAMAYLITESGYSSLAKQVQQTNNHVYINDIKDGPVLDWIHESGLTQKEVARIQPTYNCFMLGTCPPTFLERHIVWITIALSAVLWIALEWIGYKMLYRFFPKDKKIRNVLLICIGLGSLAILYMLGFLFYEHFRYPFYHYL